MSAPVSIDVKYNYNSSTCAVSTLAGKGIEQSVGNGNGSSRKSSLAVLACGGGSSSLTTTQVSCPASGTMASSPTVVNATNTQNSGGTTSF